MDADQSNDTDFILRASNVGRRTGHVARAFITFREEHDTAWEVIEAIMTTAVFVMLFLGYEAQEHFIGLLSHALVGILLVLKFASLTAAWWARHHSPGLGID